MNHKVQLEAVNKEKEELKEKFMEELNVHRVIQLLGLITELLNDHSMIGISDGSLCWKELVKCFLKADLHWRTWIRPHSVYTG